MLRLKHFTFNPFQENTYILFDESGECVIIDPGCYEPNEKEELFHFIQEEKLKPVKLLNTHCHIDHVLGNKFINESFGLKPHINSLEIPVLNAAKNYGALYGIYMDESPEPEVTLTDNGTVNFGETTLKTILAPGHSPGSICFYSEESNILIGGDVLFRMSIGRSDFPGGNLDTLLNSIRHKLFILPGETIVYPGHGPETTIDYEKKSNPFLLTYK